MPTLEHKAVYTRREAEIALSSGGGCMILEELDAPIEERLTVSCLTKNKKGKLIDVETGKESTSVLATTTDVDQAEFFACKSTELHVGNSNLIDLWISPPHQLRSIESRINASVTYSGEDLIKILPYIEVILRNKTDALKRIFENGNAVLMYAIPSSMTAQECLLAAQKVRFYSQLDNFQVNTPEELRRTTTVFQSHPDNWAFILFDLGIISKDVLKKIESKEVFKMRQKANYVSEKIKDEFLEEYIQAGEEVIARTNVVNKMRNRASDYGYTLTQRNYSCPLSGRDISFFDFTNSIFNLNTLSAEEEANKYKYTEKGLCLCCKEIKMIAPPPHGCRWCKDCTVKDNRKRRFLSL